MEQRCYGDLLDSRSIIAIIRGKKALVVRQAIPTWASKFCNMFNGKGFATRETLRGGGYPPLGFPQKDSPPRLDLNNGGHWR